MAAETDGIMAAVALQRVWLRKARASMRAFAKEPCGANDAYAEWAIAFVRDERSRRHAAPRPMALEATTLSAYAMVEHKPIAQRLAEKRAREAHHATA